MLVMIGTDYVSSFKPKLLCDHYDPLMEWLSKHIVTIIIIIINTKT